MKKFFLLSTIILFLFELKSIGQPNFSKGVIVKSNNESEEGEILTSFNAGGSITFKTQGNKKVTYAPSQLKSFSVDSINYLSYSNDFYKEIVNGKKACLYQKCTDNSNNKIFNGAQFVGFVKTTAGKIGDFYFCFSNKSTLDLVTRRNFKVYFADAINEDNSLHLMVKNGEIDFAQIKKMVELLND